MRVPELFKHGEPVTAMEFFPPRNEAAAKTFGNTIDTLSAFKPGYMSVTFGAGGSTRDGSYQTVKQILIDKKQPTVAYIAGYGLSPQEISKVLDRYKDLGIETIFVIRGDVPQDPGFAAHPDSFSFASDMIEFIKENYDFSLGCAGYPEGHIDAESLEKDIAFLKLKVDKGAEYVVTQYVYDNAMYFDYVEKCRAAGIHVPILPGIMPVYTVKMTRNLARICGSTITPGLEKRLDAVDAGDKDTVIAMGIDFATEQCRGLLKQGAPGLHFYTMGRSYSTSRIIETLQAENLL